MGRPKSKLTKENRHLKGLRIRELRKLIGFSRPDLERKYGINASTLRSAETGINALTISLARNLCLIAEDNGYSCTIHWLLEGKGEPPKITQTKPLRETDLPSPSLDEKVMSALLESQTLAISYDVRNFLNSYKGYDVDVYRVCDDSMVPQFKKGDYVGGIAIKLEKLENYIDHPLIFELANGNKVLRNISKYGLDYFLYGSNFKYAETANIIFNPSIVKAFPVFWHRSLISPWIGEV